MELSSPITVYWDLPAGEAEAPFLTRIFDDIIACRPLMLQIHSPEPILRESVAELLERAKGSGIAVSLTIPGFPIKGELFENLHRLGLKEVLLDTVSVAGVRSELPFSIPGLGISFRVTADNWQRLPELIGLCRENGVRRLVLPMQRLYSGETPFSIGPEEQRDLADSLASVDGVTGMEMTIHDPFLWRAFNPGVPFPQGGCQAANTMVAIAPDGVVYPCPALPVSMGRIGERSLREIIASPGKKEFRRRLLHYPAECGGCPEIDICKGGCRGRGYLLRGSLDGLDPACGR